MNTDEKRVGCRASLAPAARSVVLSVFICGHFLEVTVYKLLLCWRYLLTRYLALVCIVSVMLGVATLIVVNSVMAGFSTKLRDRLHGMLSDVVIESVEMEGFPDPEGQMRRIRESNVGQYVQAMTPTIEVFALMQFTVPRPVGDSTVAMKVQLVGVDPQGR